MKTYKKIFYLLTPKDRRQSFYLFLMILVMALLEMIGVVSIMPFIAVLSNPNVVETNALLNKAFNTVSKFGIDTNLKFLFFLGIFFAAFLIISLIFKAYTSYRQSYFTSMCQYRISKRFVDKYLAQKYTWFLDRNSSDLAKNILSEVGVIISKGLRPSINLITYSLVTFLLITMLTVVNTKLALITASVFGLLYFLIFKFVKIYLTKIGEERLKSNQLRFSLINEAFGAVKEIKIFNLEKIFVKKFSVQAKSFAKNEALGQIISQLPRFFLEAITFGGMMLVLLFLMNLSNNISDILPIMTLYALAGYKLIPALQLVYNSISQLRLVSPSLEVLYKDMTTMQDFEVDKNYKVLEFNKDITLSNISFTYPGTSKKIINDINLNIPANNTVAFVGSTGSGKSTLVDIILGLIDIQKGKMEVDGKVINNKNLRSWQTKIGYVPQNIYLSDDTIAANIAFGIDKNDIDYQKLQQVAKISNLETFVINDLPLQYQTMVGERGIKLSGGQKQRLGIARALYRNPSVLVLDEATSALDTITEKKVMDEVYNLKKNLTIIIVAHRLSSLKKCDKIFHLENGRFKSEGSFEHLSQNTQIFKE